MNSRIANSFSSCGAGGEGGGGAGGGGDGEGGGDENGGGAGDEAHLPLDADDEEE